MRRFIDFIIRINNKQLRKRELKGLEGIALLRENLFYTILLLVLFIGFFAYLPGVLISFKEKLWGVVAIDTIVYFSLFGMYFNKSVPTKIKVLTLLLLIYLLAIFLIVYLGPYGAGLIWLIGFSIIASIFLGYKQALFTILINLLTIVFFGIAIKLNLLNTPFFVEYSMFAWTAVAINLVVVNVISTVSVVYFIQGLEKSLISERELKQKLKKKSERLISAKMKAEESDELKSAFLANVSHEFRTPMNVILGFTEIMLYTQPSEEKRTHYLENIHNSGEQLLQIIHNTIEYSKIEMGKIDFDPSKVEVREIFETVYEQLKSKCPKGVEFDFVYNKEETDVYIVTDREKLIQIFANLVTNAFKFTTKGTVLFGQLDSEHDKFFKFFVKDTGIGIKKEKQKDIFTRFHKEDDFKEGTGLGLSISATLIAHMGGRIWLESEPGKGTHFNFILPQKLVLRDL